MSAIDFSKFKKTGQDKKCATLVHPDGHEIKIAIANLSPALRKELEKLPLHQAEGSEAPVEPMDNESPAKASDAPQQTLASNDQTIPNNVPQGAPSAEEPVTDSSSAPPAPEQAPTQQPAAAVPAPPPTPEQEALAKTQENMSFGQDLSNGHISPKTYGDLFAEKSTLGKVKTLFGLMLSGAGAGLTHQPNALLSMMDRQIQNDLEAQKTDQSNKQNWFKLSMEHTRNQATNALTSSEAYLKASEADKQQMLNNAMGVVNHEASVNAKNSMLVTYLQDQQNTINKMPPGPARDVAQAQQNNNMALAQNQMYQSNLAVAQQKQQMMGAGQSQGIAKTNPPPVKGYATPGTHYDVIDQNKKNMAFEKGRLFGPDAGKVQGAIPVGEQPKIDEEIEHLATNRNNWSDAQDAFNKLAKIKNAGQVPGAGALGSAGTALGSLIGAITGGGPATAAVGGALGHFGGALAGETVKGYFERQRQVQVDALVQRLRGAGWGDVAARDQAESILPKWSDDAKQLPEVHYQLQQHFKANEDKKFPRLKQYELLAPQPKYKYEGLKNFEVPIEKPTPTQQKFQP